MSEQKSKTQSKPTEPTQPTKRKLTGLDYYLMALEAEGVPFSQIAGEIDQLSRVR